MSERRNPTPDVSADAGRPRGWTRARLVEPATAGFVHLGVGSGRWRFPWRPMSGRREPILAALREAARALREEPQVVRADVFEAILRPPGRRGRGALRTLPADFDAVLLVETRTVADADALIEDPVLTRLETDLKPVAARILTFAASNARRIAPVDHDRPGVFLFNYFSAPDVETTLHAWQYTAGWFQDETGLDNSTVLSPLTPDTVPYTLVNHCRWDRLRDVLPALVLKRSFHSFVLRVFDQHRVTPDPVLYRLSDTA